MKDIMFFGDFISDTGPGIANRSFMKGFSELNFKVGFSKHNHGVLRIIEAVWGVITAKKVCLCYSSKITYLIIPICKLIHKRIIYLIHGYGRFESELNKCSVEKIDRIGSEEDRIYRNANIIVCVSKFFCEFMKTHEMQYKEKFRFFYNAIDIKSFEEYHGVKENIVLSLGGGLGLKNNIAVCRAIDALNKQGFELKYIVVGPKGTDYEKIIEYPFVEYHDSLKHEEVLMIMRKANVYIQNSWFESFGLAPIEALFSGCDIIITRYQGIKDLFQCNEEELCIGDPDDIEQLQMMIRRALLQGNNSVLMNAFDDTKVEPSNVAKVLYDVIMHA